MTTHPKPESSLGGWFSGRIDVGTTIYAGVLLVGIATYVVTSRNHADVAQQDIATIKATMAVQFDQLRVTQDRMKDELLKEIRSNPLIDQHFANIEKWISATEAYRTAHEARIAEMQRDDARMRADIDAMIRASNAPLRTAR